MIRILLIAVNFLPHFGNHAVPAVYFHIIPEHHRDGCRQPRGRARPARGAGRLQGIHPTVQVATMKSIGIIFGMENTFPAAVVDRINGMFPGDVRAEFVKLGGVFDIRASGYDVLIDRISHDIPFYRSYLKNAALQGTYVINNPFWWSADDKFVEVQIARRAGLAVPRTGIIPTKEHPPNTTTASMRNLEYPLNWEEIFSYIGFPLFMKPHDGGGWKHVYKIHTPEEFFFFYNQSGSICMMLQEAIEYDSYYRCYCVGRRDVHIMPYAPHHPMHLRYVIDYPSRPLELLERIERDVLSINRALGYDMNTVEFAVRDGVPYAIDYMNPAPDCDSN